MDIEDAVSEALPARISNFVIARLRLKSSTNDDISVTSDLPEKYKIFVQTWGCTHNTSDSEYMAGLLSQYGYNVILRGSQRPPVEKDNFKCDCGETSEGSCCAERTGESRSTTLPVSDEEAKQQADVWVLNSCTVKGPAEDHFRNAVLAGLQLGKRLVVAGCVPQSRPGLDYLKGVSIIGVQQIDRVVEVVEETLKGNTVRFLEKKMAAVDSQKINRRLGGAPLDLPKIRRNPLIEILAVSTGCLNACTYCKTKHARGVLASYPIEELLNRAQQAFADGVKELWLTSEDLGAYGRDLPRSTSRYSCPSMADRFPDYLTLADLLSGLVRIIPSGCMLRLGMTNPPYMLDQLQEVADVLSHPRVYSFLHIPVQSGSDAVLEQMRREYTSDDFCKVMEYIQEHVTPPTSSPSSPQQTGCGRVTIATDIICGFPNEMEADFEETVMLIERYKFPVLYINQFFARPGTPAATMVRKATTAEVKKRTKRLHELFRTYSPYTERVGADVRVLITETSHDGRYWVGHTKAYEQVLVPKLPDVLGRIVLVRIIKCDKFFMLSEIVDLGPFDSLLFPTPSQTVPQLQSLARLKEHKTIRASRLLTSKTKESSHADWFAFVGLVLLLSYGLLKLMERWDYFA